MNRIAIVADTSQDLDFKTAEKYNIYLIPYYIQMGEDHLKDLVEIDKKTFYETMDSYDILSTGTPPISDVIEKLEELEKKRLSRSYFNYIFWKTYRHEKCLWDS